MVVWTGSRLGHQASAITSWAPTSTQAPHSLEHYLCSPRKDQLITWGAVTLFKYLQSWEQIAALSDILGSSFDLRSESNSPRRQQFSYWRLKVTNKFFYQTIQSRSGIFSRRINPDRYDDSPDILDSILGPQIVIRSALPSPLLHSVRGMLSTAVKQMVWI